METPVEQTLLEDLSSPRKTVRLNALLKASGFAADERIRSRLEELRQEPDDEIAVFAELALIRAKSGPRVPASVPDAAAASAVTDTPGAVPSSGTEPSSEASAAVDADVPAPTPEELIHGSKKNAPDILRRLRRSAAVGWQERLRPAAAIFLGKHGTVEDAPLLEQWLTGRAGPLEIPVLEALGRIDREKALVAIPAFLTSDQPFLRSRAILLLRSWDSDEALNHLAELLGSDNAEERLAGLLVAMLFPFETVAPLLFVMLTTEGEHEVFKQAALLIVSNPELESAFRLYELRETLSETRRQWVTAILQLLGKALGTIGAIESADAAPDAFLEWLKPRFQERYLKELELRILLGDPEQLAAIGLWLTGHAQEPLVAGFLARLSRHPATEEWIKSLGVAAEETPGDDESADRKSLPAQRLEQVQSWKRGLPPEAYEQALAYALDPDPRVCAGALQALTEASPSATESVASRWVEVAEKNLAHENPLVACRAVRLLEKHDPQGFQKKLPVILQHPEPLVWTRVLLSALKLLPEEVLRHLTRLLKSNEATQRAQAVKALLLCPFEQTRNLIMSALPREEHPQIAKGLILLLLNNPSLEVFDELELLPPPRHAGVALLVAKAREQLFAILRQIGLWEGRETPMKPGESGLPKSSGLTAKPDVSPERPAAASMEPAKAYSARAVRDVIRRRKTAPPAESETGAPGFFDQTWVWAFSGVLCIWLVFWGVARLWPVREIQTAGAGKDNAPYIMVDGFRMNVLCRMQGKVTGVASDQTIRFDADQRRFRLKPVASPPVLFGVSDALVEAVPYRLLSSGEILAICYSLKALP